MLPCPRRESGAGRCACAEGSHNATGFRSDCSTVLKQIANFCNILNSRRVVNVTC